LIPKTVALSVPLAQLGVLEIHQVRRTAAEKLFGSLMEAHHYLGYTRPVGDYAEMGIMLSCLGRVRPQPQLFTN
jgi:hypothetical protein